MPTYGCLHGQHVIVNMTEANFEAIEPGIRHVMKVVVRNISMRGQRVRIVPPQPKEFTLHIQNDVDLAPGIEMQAELAYYSEEPVDVAGTMAVLVGRADSPHGGEHLEIPVRATLPGAKIAFDAPVDFGVVVPGQHLHRDVVVTNTGHKDGKMSIGACPAGAKFTVLPLEHHIPAGDSAKFHVELK